MSEPVVKLPNGALNWYKGVPRLNVANLFCVDKLSSWSLAHITICMCFQNPIPIVFKFIAFVFWDVGCLCERVVSVNPSFTCLTKLLFEFFFVVINLCPSCSVSVAKVRFWLFCPVFARVSLRWSVVTVCFLLRRLKAFWSLPHCMMRCLNPETKHSCSTYSVGGQQNEWKHHSIQYLYYDGLIWEKESVRLSVNLTSASKYFFKPADKENNIYLLNEPFSW